MRVISTILFAIFLGIVVTFTVQHNNAKAHKASKASKAIELLPVQPVQHKPPAMKDADEFFGAWEPQVVAVNYKGCSCGSNCQCSTGDSCGCIQLAQADEPLLFVKKKPAPAKPVAPTCADGQCAAKEADTLTTAQESGRVRKFIGRFFHRRGGLRGGCRGGRCG